MSYKELTIQLQVALDTDNVPMMLAALKDLYYEYNDKEAGLLFAVKSMMCSEGYVEESEEVLLELLDSSLEELSAVWAVYMHTRIFTLYNNLEKFVESLSKYPGSSIANYALAFYYDYESNHMLSKHHIDMSIELEEYPANLIFYAIRFCKKQKDKLKYIEKALKMIIKNSIEEEPSPNTITLYLDDYYNELLLQRHATTSYCQIIQKEAEELRRSRWGKIKSTFFGC